MSMLLASYQISVVNTQSQATPTNFQQLIQTTLQYPSGVRFWSPIDGWLYGWLESLSSTNQANIWVKIPSSIPANGVYQIYMVEDSSLNFDGNYWGEAPNLSSTYGQYDNGANVFDFYDNFAGTSLSSKWTSGTSGGTISVDNGLTETLPYNAATGSYVYVSTSSYTITSAQIVESYANLNGFDTTNFRIVPVALTQYNNAPWHADNSTNENAVGWAGDAQATTTVSAETTTSTASDAFETSQITSTSAYQLWGVIYPNTGSVSVQYNYNNWGSTTTYVPATPLYITMSNYINPSQTVHPTTYPINVYYIRARTYPPNGVMPSVNIGASQYSGELITVTVP